VRRVLRPGGSAFISVPAFLALWGLQDDLAHHRHRYRREELLRLIRDAGLEEERTTYFNTFLFLPTWVGRRILRLISPRIHSEAQINAPGVNALLRWLFSAERHLLRWLDLPFGVSIFCLARRPL
jgi:hypothetical protein